MQVTLSAWPHLLSELAVCMQRFPPSQATCIRARSVFLSNQALARGSVEIKTKHARRDPSGSVCNLVSTEHLGSGGIEP
jgi:hypothetical protein